MFDQEKMNALPPEVKKVLTLAVMHNPLSVAVKEHQKLLGEARGVPLADKEADDFAIGFFYGAKLMMDFHEATTMLTQSLSPLTVATFHMNFHDRCQDELNKIVEAHSEKKEAGK